MSGHVNVNPTEGEWRSQPSWPGWGTSVLALGSGGASWTDECVRPYV